MDKHNQSLKIPTVEVDDFFKWCKIMSELQDILHRPTDGINYSGYWSWGFRGQENADWPISSTFERAFLNHDKINDDMIERRLRIKELSLISDFQKDAYRYIEHEPKNLLEWLSLMRHYGIPTRLVDISASPFIALYFAVCNNAKTPFAIWAIPTYDTIPAPPFTYLQNYFSKKHSPVNFVNWVQKISDTQLFDKTLISSKKEEFFNWLLGRTPKGHPVKLSSNRSCVLSISPDRNNHRISAQAGSFLFPTVLSKSFMENLSTSLLFELKTKDLTTTQKISEISSIKEYPIARQPYKFVFPAEMRQIAKAFLATANITHRTLFPDLTGVTMSLS
jgi:hypothetical protein